MTLDNLKKRWNMMNTKNLRKILKEDGIIVGSEVNEVRSPAIAEIYASAGLDFIVVDMEHTSFSLSEASQIYRVARNCGISPLVRIPTIEYSVICRNLDQGAQGIIVPRVSSKEEVLQVVDMMKYPPYGQRGLYPGGTISQFSPIPARDIIQNQNEDILLIIQIESEKAVEKLDEILSISEIDVILFGPADLSISIGHPCEFLHEEVLSLMRKGIQKCREVGIPVCVK